MNQAKAQKSSEMLLKIALHCAFGLTWFIISDLVGILLIVEPINSSRLGSLMVCGSNLDLHIGLFA